MGSILASPLQTFSLGLISSHPSLCQCLPHSHAPLCILPCTWPKGPAALSGHDMCIPCRSPISMAASLNSHSGERVCLIPGQPARWLESRQVLTPGLISYGWAVDAFWLASFPVDDVGACSCRGPEERRRWGPPCRADKLTGTSVTGLGFHAGMTHILTLPLCVCLVGGDCANQLAPHPRQGCSL